MGCCFLKNIGDNIKMKSNHGHHYPTLMTELPDFATISAGGLAFEQNPEWSSEDCRLTFNIGHGKMGKIWLCKNPKYVIKVIKKNKEELLTEWVKKEYTNLINSNICRCYGYKKEAELSLFLLEYVGGTNLEELNKHQLPMKDNIRYKMYYQMIQAVNYCHQHKIVHRDIKLANFILNQNSTPMIKLIDFDFTLPFDQSPFSTQHGDFHYWSPEVLTKNYDYRCDVWALTVCLFIFETKKFPFVGQTPEDLQTAILNSNPLYDNLPKTLRPYLKQLFHLDIEYRPSLFQFLVAPIWP